MKKHLLPNALGVSTLATILAVAGAVPGALSAQSCMPASPVSSEAASDQITSGPEHYLLYPREYYPAAIDVVATESLDVTIARAIRGTNLQDNGTARDVAGVFRLASLPGTLLLAGVLYGIGEIDNRPDLSDLGLFTGQAIVGAGAVTLAGKLATGRARPRISPEDASDFGFGRGFRGDDFQSFPSAHTAAAFAAGTVLAMDIAERHPGAAIWVYPSIYAAASMAGLSRLFEEEHWATDIVGGALVGIAGGIVVRRVHGEAGP